MEQTQPAASPVEGKVPCPIPEEGGLGGAEMPPSSLHLCLPHAVRAAAAMPGVPAGGRGTGWGWEEGGAPPFQIPVLPTHFRKQSSIPWLALRLKLFLTIFPKLCHYF